MSKLTLDELIAGVEHSDFHDADKLRLAKACKRYREALRRITKTVSSDEGTSSRLYNDVGMAAIARAALAETEDTP